MPITNVSYRTIFSSVSATVLFCSPNWLVRCYLKVIVLKWYCNCRQTVDSARVITSGKDVGSDWWGHAERRCLQFRHCTPWNALSQRRFLAYARDGTERWPVLPTSQASQKSAKNSNQIRNAGGSGKLGCKKSMQSSWKWANGPNFTSLNIYRKLSNMAHWNNFSARIIAPCLSALKEYRSSINFNLYLHVRLQNEWITFTYYWERQFK